MVKIIVNGADGKMGQIACAAIKNDPNLELLRGLGKADNVAKAIQETKADAVLDFTSATAVYDNTRAIILAGAKPIIGTSGLLPAAIVELQELAKSHKIGGIIVPNFSLGAVLMMQFAKQAGKFFPAAAIVEAHHPAKKDAPSQTARRTAELIAEARDLNHQEYPGINIHSIRMPGLICKQQVLFGGQDETLMIEHNTLHRNSFIPGILLACTRVPFLTELLVGLENLLVL